MKLGFIVPTAYLEEFAILSDFHLVLAHLVDQDKTYANFYKKRADAGDFILMDCSIFELGVSYDPSKLIYLAYLLGAKEVVVPEALKDSKESLRLADEFLKEVSPQDRKAFQFSATIQGNSFFEFVKHYDAIRHTFGNQIKVINIPFDLDIDIPGAPHFLSPTLQRVMNRIYLIEGLINEGVLDENREHHLMGLADGVELQHYAQAGYDFIRSNDSSSCFVHGAAGILYENRGLPCEKIKQKLDFSMNVVLTEYQKESIRYNINMLKQFCS